MSGPTVSEQPPLDIVKVEEEEKEEDGTGGLDPDTVGRGNEVDIDVELLKTVASQLSSGPWLSCGSDGGKKLGRKLLDLGEKLEGWKKWEGLCRSKGEELRDVMEQLKESESRLEMVKGNKAELRKTYDSEVDRRIKAERGVAELKKKAGERVVFPVMKEVRVQTAASSKPNHSMMVLQGSDLQVSVPLVGMEEVVAASSSEDIVPEKGDPKWRNRNQEKFSDNGDEKDLAETGKAVADASGTTSSLPGTSYNPRRRSGRNTRKKHVRLASDSDNESRINVEDETKTAALSRPPSKNERRIANRSSSEGQRFKCSRCKAVLSNQRNLTRHLKEVHAKEERGNFSCYVCNKRFLHKSNLMQHLKTHPRNQSYRCKTCSTIFKKRACLQKHMKIHDTSRERKLTCSICSMKFFRSQNLARHKVTHRSEKPFKCPRCPQRFKLAYLAKIHLATHSNLTPFKCELCEKSFKLSGYLKLHLRTHTGERPFSCRICKERFTLTSNLSRHMKTHQGEEGKNHQCPFCNKKFFRKFRCREHQKRIHKSELALSKAELEGEGGEPGHDQDDLT